MENKQIYQLIPIVSEAIGAVEKSRRNQGQGYDFRGIDDIMNSVHGPLHQYGVFCVPEIISQSREEKQTAKGGTLIYSILTVKYTFFAPDGSSVSSVVVGEGMDSGDKSSNKAMSAAFKYCLGQVFSIPFENIDSENDNPTVSPKSAKPKPTIPKAETPLPATQTPPVEPKSKVTLTTPTGKHVESVGEISARQQKTIWDLAKKRDIANREEALQVVTAYVGREIKALTELSAVERDQVILKFEELINNG